MQEQTTTPATFSRGFRLAGAAVHLYTATGTVVGLLIVLAAIEGETVTALWLFFLALFIDGTDGTLARRFRVKETIPWFDGARLDDIVDYLTYVFAPVVLLWTTGSLPGRGAGLGGRGAAAAGVELPVLPGRREARRRLGRRPLLPGLPELLERARLLRDRPGRLAGRRRGRAGRVLRAGVRADPLPLPVADDDAAHDDAGVQRRVGGHLRRAAAAVPRPAPGRRGGLAWPTSSTTSA